MEVKRKRSAIRFCQEINALSESLYDHDTNHTLHTKPQLPAHLFRTPYPQKHIQLTCKMSWRRSNLAILTGPGVRPPDEPAWLAPLQDARRVRGAAARVGGTRIHRPCPATLPSRSAGSVLPNLPWGELVRIRRVCDFEGRVRVSLRRFLEINPGVWVAAWAFVGWGIFLGRIKRGGGDRCMGLLCLAMPGLNFISMLSAGQLIHQLSDIELMTFINMKNIFTALTILYSWVLL